jgi:hypothetical protein
VDEVVLGDEGQVTADGAGGGLLDGIGATGDLAERGSSDGKNGFPSCSA